MTGGFRFTGRLARLGRLSIATKLLIFLALLSVISFSVMGAVAIFNMNRIGTFSEESSNALGSSAARDSITSLEELGEEAIKQKAIDIAGKIRVYLESRAGLPRDELAKDSYLSQLAVEPVGQTGYTALYEKETGVMIFHPNPGMVNFDMHNLSEKLPSWWMVFRPSLRGGTSSGYYDWEDVDGTIREKFMYMVPVEGTRYMVAATTYIDEFSQPGISTRNKILAATLQATNYINGQIRNTEMFFLVLFSVLLVVIVGLSFRLSRLITNPIKVLKQGSEIIGGGNLDHRVELHTGDELEDLANSFNKMALDLKTHVEELRRTTAVKERVEKELDLARGIQQSFLPEAPPKVAGFDLAALNTPALEVGGDFFDYIPVALDQWGLVIADVSGKGFPAALFMALSRTMLRANTVGNPTVSQTITRANNMIAEEGRANMFVTLFYGVLDPKRKTLTYVNAGHNPPFVTDRKGGDIVMLAAKGIALGVMSDMEFEEKQVALHEGDILLLYTDGVTEAVNRHGELFGQDRLAKLVEENQDRPAQEIIKIIEQAVIAYAEGLPQFDDLTLMAVKVI